LQDGHQVARHRDHIWMGMSVEDEAVLSRIADLQVTEARVKWLSLEPLLGPLPNLSLDGIDWVVVGGESGPGARPMKVEWVHEIRDRCLAEEVPFFFKQWGGVHKKKAGRVLDGRSWDQYPNQDP
jgi:protein gp37